jgi:hypothetical protein
LKGNEQAQQKKNNIIVPSMNREIPRKSKFCVLLLFTFIFLSLNVPEIGRERETERERGKKGKVLKLVSRKYV